MDWKLELVVVPVSDVERAKRFYSEQVGFAVDHDTKISDDMHVVADPSRVGVLDRGRQGARRDAAGDGQGLQLVVPDIEAARAQLLERGGGQPGPALRGPDRRRSRRPLELFVFFSDPDGNWAVQSARPAEENHWPMASPRAGP